MIDKYKYSDSDKNLSHTTNVPCNMEVLKFKPHNVICCEKEKLQVPIIYIYIYIYIYTILVALQIPTN